MILTDKAVFRFDEKSKLATLESVHPGISIDDVVQNTGYTHDYMPATVRKTAPPTPEELGLIREVIDPSATMLPR